MTAIAWFSPYAQNVFKGKMELTKINEFHARARLNYVMTLNLAGEIKILCSSIALTQIISFYVLQQMEHGWYAILFNLNFNASKVSVQVDDNLSKYGYPK